jgi:aldehyde dehydrogenase (NAD+)
VCVAQVLEMCKMIGPAIAAGCTSIYKTNEWTPLSVCTMVTLIEAAKWPAGLVNVLHGGVPLGKLISSHMGIRKIVFTGSVRAGLSFSYYLLPGDRIHQSCQLFGDSVDGPRTYSALIGSMCTHSHEDKPCSTGKEIQIACANSNLKPVCLELGGKSANIIFADADLDAAAKNVLMAFTTNSGQCCCAGTRVSHTHALTRAHTHAST